MSLWRKNPERPVAWGGAGALLVPLLAVALATGLGFAGQTDELKFHWDTVRQFGAALPALPLADYHAATTPLPYVLWGAWGKAFGYGLPALRALTLVVSAVGILAFYALARARRHPWPLAESLLLLFSPYVFLNSFTLYTVNVGLVFAVLAIWGYLNGRFWPLVGAGLAAAAAIYCRQHYLFLPAGAALFWLIQGWRERTWFRPPEVARLALIALPALLFAPLALQWGGITPPAFQALHPLQLRPEHLTFLLVFVGFYCAPAGIPAWPEVLRWGRRAAALALGVPLYALWRPYYQQLAEGPESSEQGIVLHGLDVASRSVGTLLPAAGQFLLWANGLMIGATALLRPQPARRSEERQLWCLLAAFAAILLVSDYVGERFYALVVPVLLMLFYPRVASRRMLTVAWVAGTAVLGVGYAILKMRGG
jgi:hypothetical protein